MDKKDLSIIIQGPLNKVSLDNLEYYKSLGQVIISYWDTCQQEILSNYDLNGVVCQRKKLPDQNVIRYATTYKTFSYQVFGVFYGLQSTTTEFVIRTRSDERYNLAELIKKFEENTDKIVCNNILFKKWSVYGWHPSDHCFIGKTKVLLDSYKKIIDSSLTKIPDNQLAEAIFAYSVLETLGAEPTKENFIKVFDVVDVNKMKPFIARWNQAGILYENEFISSDCIRTMEDL